MVSSACKKEPIKERTQKPVTPKLTPTGQKTVRDACDQYRDMACNCASTNPDASPHCKRAKGYVYAAGVYTNINNSDTSKIDPAPGTKPATISEKRALSGQKLKNLLSKCISAQTELAALACHPNQ